MIVRANPAASSDLDRSDQAWFDSDATTNIDAIQEIELEAAKYGLVRAREYWLQTFKMPDGKIVRRGFCYRPEPWGMAEGIAARRGNDEKGQTAAQTVREMRE